MPSAASLQSPTAITKAVFTDKNGTGDDVCPAAQLDGYCATKCPPPPRPGPAIYVILGFGSDPSPSESEAIHMRIINDGGLCTVSAGSECGAGMVNVQIKAVLDHQILYTYNQIGHQLPQFKLYMTA